MTIEEKEKFLEISKRMYELGRTHWKYKDDESERKKYDKMVEHTTKEAEEFLTSIYGGKVIESPGGIFIIDNVEIMSHSCHTDYCYWCRLNGRGICVREFDRTHIYNILSKYAFSGNTERKELINNHGRMRDWEFYEGDLDIAEIERCCKETSDQNGNRICRDAKVVFDNAGRLVLGYVRSFDDENMQYTVVSKDGGETFVREGCEILVVGDFVWK